MKKASKLNLFRDYLSFLSDNDELNIEKKSLFQLLPMTF